MKDIHLYTAPTSNGWKPIIFLEEADIEYDITAINFDKREQKEKEYLKLNPNGRIPTIVDRSNNNFVVFESGAILMYLGEKSGKFFPQSDKERIRVLEWLFWEIGGLGPMAGQVSHFVNYAPNFPGDHSYSEKRYKNEYDRLLGVMDMVLEERDYLAGDYSIADMASFPWVTAYKRYEVNLDTFKNVRRWFDEIKSRPAVRKGMDVGKENRNFGKGISKESLKTMFGQDSKSIKEEAKKKLKD